MCHVILQKVYSVPLLSSRFLLYILWNVSLCAVSVVFEVAYIQMITAVFLESHMKGFILAFSKCCETSRSHTSKRPPCLVPYCWGQIHHDLFVFFWALWSLVAIKKSLYSDKNGGKAAIVITAVVQTWYWLEESISSGAVRNDFSGTEQRRRGGRFDTWGEE